MSQNDIFEYLIVNVKRSNFEFNFIFSHRYLGEKMEWPPPKLKICIHKIASIIYTLPTSIFGSNIFDTEVPEES